MDISVRSATPEDDEVTEQIEVAADALLIDRFRAVDWPPPTSPHERTSAPGFVLVAESLGDEDDAVPGVVGFVHVMEIDGHAHLEQLSVLPAYGRRGIGRRLVEAALAEARRRGHSEITLRTYVDVPWNAPFYASCGFVESEPETPLLRGLVHVETALGLFAHGPRVQMTATL
ncbi:GNAT family N-acetyltransferase [Microbacterium sp. MYb62]|uniref:GNAT family N-acetyltransferase n=1 Tax=Microbacterium sp. MYb62 TaxID=1848690 RepID=UPI000CFC5CFE|nr:GNAT family N-acetyltransferase [Microbacterium sp. MYb62]PRB11035.1 GNAT family N-acetyltransferase [Microbacterium sp. MYb62]